MFVLYLNANYKVFVAQLVKNLPAVQETRVWSLGWEYPLEKEMASHSSILAWKISWTEEPGGMQSMGSQRVGHDWAANTNTNKGVRNFEKISLKEMCSFALSPSCCYDKDLLKENRTGLGNRTTAGRVTKEKQNTRTAIWGLLDLV